MPETHQIGAKLCSCSLLKSKIMKLVKAMLQALLMFLPKPLTCVIFYICINIGVDKLIDAEVLSIRWKEMQKLMHFILTSCSKHNWSVLLLQY